MATDQDQHEPECAQCHSPIHLGRDALRLQEGVIGNRGFVELETMVFCSDSCLQKHTCSHELIKVDRRVP